VPRILLTGMSGAGKSTVLTELRRRGHLTIDTDYGGWVLPDGRWDEPRMTTLLQGHADLIVSGTVENQGRFYSWFDHVVLLHAPLEVLLARTAERTDNPYGKTAAHRAEIARYTDEIVPLLRRSATVELDARRPLGELADAIEVLLSSAAGPPA
jgi:dephospho-CoA kinase